MTAALPLAAVAQATGWDMETRAKYAWSGSPSALQMTDCTATLPSQLVLLPMPEFADSIVGSTLQQDLLGDRDFILPVLRMPGDGEPLAVDPEAIWCFEGDPAALVFRRTQHKSATNGRMMIHLPAHWHGYVVDWQLYVRAFRDGELVAPVLEQEGEDFHLRVPAAEAPRGQT